MSRREGTLKLSSNIEPRASAPLDARLVVPTLADLTTSGAFPYPYVGMIVSVQSEGKAYMLTASDPTVSANWSEIGSGGSSNALEVIDELPIATAEFENKQYYLTNNQSGFAKGAVYECIEEPNNPGVYNWKLVSTNYRSISKQFNGDGYVEIYGFAGGKYLIQNGFYTFIISNIYNGGWTFMIDMIGQEIGDIDNTTSLKQPVYSKSSHTSTDQSKLLLYSEGYVTVTQLSGTPNDNFTFGSVYTVVPSGYIVTDFNSPASLRQGIAPLFDSLSSYSVGDLVWYRNTSWSNPILFKCTTDHTGAWNISHFERTSVAQEINNCGGDSIQVEELPDPATAPVGAIYQYIGETTSDYVNGYFYTPQVSGTPVVSNINLDSASDMDTLLPSPYFTKTTPSSVETVWSVNPGYTSEVTVLADGTPQTINVIAAYVVQGDNFAAFRDDDPNHDLISVRYMTSLCSLSVTAWERVDVQPEGGSSGVIPVDPSDTSNINIWIETL